MTTKDEALALALKALKPRPGMPNPKPVGEVYGWHGSGKGQPMCRFDATEQEMPVGTKLYTAPPQRQPLTNPDEFKCPICYDIPRQWVGLNWDDLPAVYVGDIAFLHGAQWAEATLREKNT